MKVKNMAWALESHRRFMESGGTRGMRADFTGMDLRGVDWPALGKVDLSGAILRRVNLFGADLRNVSLMGADLEGAILDNANMHGTNMKYANLAYACLSCGALDGAKLDGTIMRFTVAPWRRGRVCFESADDWRLSAVYYEYMNRGAL